jgi:hypothetical protein
MSRALRLALQTHCNKTISLDWSRAAVLMSRMRILLRTTV